jgi:hypothetical protein
METIRIGSARQNRDLESNGADRKRKIGERQSFGLEMPD